MSHLDDDTVAGYLRRTLEPAEREAAEAHLRECEACRELVADVAWMSTGAAEVQPDRADVGTSIGRFVILRRVGAGAFGVVYAAYDPELDRKIALKVLREDLGRPRILREAQAMARLSHPNVTAVYDVTSADGEVCIAMEFVDGVDGRAWLAQRQRSRDEILDAFLQAGEGLAAAHAAGIVHRDFKPSNMLVGVGGRVSVTDFGLARTEDKEELEAAGAIVGTPRYMAPEQRRGEATALSDQFGFCVALQEALEGAGRIPAWIRRPLARGLGEAPEDRFPSMEPLLHALSPRRRARSRRIVLTAIGAVVLATVPAAYMYDAQRSDAQACSGGPARVAEVFGDAQQAGLAAAFDRSELPYATASWTTTRQSVDAYLARWQAQYTDACEATRRGEQSQEVLTARMLCLEDARQGVQYVLDALARGSAPAIRNAVPSLQALDDLDACDDVEALLRRAPPGRDAQRLVAGVRAMLGRARASATEGDTEAANATATEAVARARELDHAPLTAEALLQQGRGFVRTGDTEAARTALREAVLLANRGRDDRLAAEAWIDLLFVHGSAVNAEALALETAHGAEAALERLGRSRVLAARHATALGLVLARAGRYEDALPQQEHAVELLRIEHGDAAAPVGVQLHRVAELEFELGRLDAAEATAERSVEIIAHTHGGDHPRVSLPLTVLAQIACAREAWSRCIEHAERAAALRVRASGKVEGAMLPIMLTHGRGLAGAGRTQDAETALRAAAQLARETYGPDNAWSGRADAELAAALPPGEEARQLATRALEVLEHTLGPTHPDTRAAKKRLAAVVVPTADRVLP